MTEISTDKAREIGAYIRRVYREEGTEGVVARAQQMVDKLAPKLAAHFPELAASDPKAIGLMARRSVMAFVKTCLQF
jgi:hypothetical protein